MGSFTAHNIRLDDGRETMPGTGWTMDQLPVFQTVHKFLRLLYPGGLQGRSIVDLGCLEGGYAVEFARLGMQSVGIEARASNFANCELVKAGVDLPSLRFVQDDVKNLPRYGRFDAVFGNGILYHLDNPVAFLRDAAAVCGAAIFLQTHIASVEETPARATYDLSPLEQHEGAQGRWMGEYPDISRDQLEALKWSSWSNPRSFWLTKAELLHQLRSLGFDLVLEDYDFMSDIRHEVDHGFYRTNDRVFVIGIRTAALAAGAELAAVRAQVAAMRQARSWRLTAPLRGVADLLRRRR